MPIRPENKARYPKDWKEISARIRRRAGDCCEVCGVANQAWGWREPDGTFHEVPKGPLRDAGHRKTPFEVATHEGRMLKVIEIVLTVAHLDHIPEHCGDGNLQAMCQRCHLRYDVEHHRRTRLAGLRCKETCDLFPA